MPLLQLDGYEPVWREPGHPAKNENRHSLDYMEPELQCHCDDKYKSFGFLSALFPYKSDGKLISGSSIEKNMEYGFICFDFVLAKYMSLREMVLIIIIYNNIIYWFVEYFVYKIGF